MRRCEGIEASQGRRLILSQQICLGLTISGTFISMWPRATCNLGHGYQGRNLKSGRMTAHNSDPQLDREVRARTTQPGDLGSGHVKGQGRALLSSAPGAHLDTKNASSFIGFETREEFRTAILDAQRRKGSTEGAGLQERARPHTVSLVSHYLALRFQESNGTLLGLGFLMDPRSIVNCTLHECMEGIWTVPGMGLPS